MYFMGCNAAGLLNKLESLKRNIKMFNPGAIFIQESKTKRKNKVKLTDYVIFEKIRINRGGGGLLTGVHKNLEPMVHRNRVTKMRKIPSLENWMRKLKELNYQDL